MSRLSNEYASWQCSPNVEKAEAEIWDGNPSERKSSMYTISKMFKKKSIDKENILPKVRSGISLKSTFGDSNIHYLWRNLWKSERDNIAEISFKLLSSEGKPIYYKEV